jgi:hypothetical protein
VEDEINVASIREKVEELDEGPEKDKVVERLRLLEDMSKGIGKEVFTATSLVSKIARGFTKSPLHIQVAMGAMLAWCAYDFVRAVNAYKTAKAEGA